MASSSSGGAFGGVVAILGFGILAALLAGIGLPGGAAMVGAAVVIAVLAVLWYSFTDPINPKMRRTVEHDVHRMGAARMTPTEIARRTGLETHQVRQILAGDDNWWIKP